MTTRIHDTLERVRTALADIHALQAGRRVLATAEPGSGDCLACAPVLTLPCYKLTLTLLEYTKLLTLARCHEGAQAEVQVLLAGQDLTSAAQPERQGCSSPTGPARDVAHAPHTLGTQRLTRPSEPTQAALSAPALPAHGRARDFGAQCHLSASSPEPQAGPARARCCVDMHAACGMSSHRLQNQDCSAGIRTLRGNEAAASHVLRCSTQLRTSAACISSPGCHVAGAGSGRRCRTRAPPAFAGTCKHCPGQCGLRLRARS